MNYKGFTIRLGGTRKYRLYDDIYPVADVKSLKEARQKINLLVWGRLIDEA